MKRISVIYNLLFLSFFNYLKDDAPNALCYVLYQMWSFRLRKKSPIKFISKGIAEILKMSQEKTSKEKAFVWLIDKLIWNGIPKKSNLVYEVEQNY